MKKIIVNESVHRLLEFNYKILKQDHSEISNADAKYLVDMVGFIRNAFLSWKWGLKGAKSISNVNLDNADKYYELLHRRFSNFGKDTTDSFDTLYTFLKKSKIADPNNKSSFKTFIADALNTQVPMPKADKFMEFAKIVHRYGGTDKFIKLWFGKRTPQEADVFTNENGTIKEFIEEVLNYLNPEKAKAFRNWAVDYSS